MPTLDASLLARIAEDPHLPTPSPLALQVIEKASRPDCALDEIGRLISHDPALCGKILKTVNSALFSMPRAVTSIQRALSLLGLRAVRSLVLSHSLPAMHDRGKSDARSQEYWKATVTGAILARQLAIRLRRPDPEDDMIASLLRDLGMLVLQQTCPEEYAQILAHPAEVLATEQCTLEALQLGLNHADVAAHLLRRWRLPDEITEAVRYHHHPEQAMSLNPVVSERAQLLFFATQVAQLQITPNLPALRQSILHQARTQFAMEEHQLQAFLDSTNAQVEELAALLNVDIGRRADYATLFANASAELVQLTVDASVDTMRLREEKNQIEQEARRWRRTAHRLRQDAVRDPLTGIYNRAFFEETLLNEFKRARRRCTILGLLFLDLDGFKVLNDRFGHLFGDQVLKETAGKLHDELRGGDVVARYGGDEFCVIVADTNEQGLKTLADRLWQAVNALTIRRDGQVGKVGVSIGAVTCFPQRSKHTYKEFLAAADKAMYAAKTTGKNQVTLLSLLTEEDHQLLVEVRKRLFSAYLIEPGGISRHDVREARRSLHSYAACIGRLARKLGWLSPRNLRAVLQEQRRTRKLFGEIAVTNQFITPGQLYGLLAIQREWPEDLADGLIDLGIVTELEAQRLLAAYYQTLQRLE